MIKQAWMWIALFCVGQAYSQKIVSVEPDSAEAGEYLPVTVTGMNANFRDFSGVYNLPYLNAKGQTIYSQYVQFPDPDHIRANFQVPATLDTGTYSMLLSMRQDIPAHPFRIVPSSGRSVFLGFAPKQGSIGRSGIITAGLRNALSLRPDRSKWTTRVDSGQKSLMPVECRFPSDSVLACAYNFDRENHIRTGDFIVAYDGTPVWTFPRTFYYTSEMALFLHPTPSVVREPGDPFGVRLTAGGNRLLQSMYYGLGMQVTLFRGSDSILALKTSYDRDSNLYANFLIPAGAQEGLWHLRLLITTGGFSSIPDTLYRFGIVRVTQGAGVPVFAASSPDTAAAGAAVELAADFLRVDWSAAPSLDEFWLTRYGRKMKPKSLSLDGANRLRATFSPGLNDSLGYWHAQAVKGTDTLTLYNAVYLKAPAATIRKVESGAAYAGGSVRMRIEGSATTFSARNTEQDIKYYPLVSLEDPYLPARNITVVNDTLLFADFHIPANRAAAASTLRIQQRPPYASPSLPQGLEIRAPGGVPLLSAVKPDTALQTEKWQVVAMGSGTDFPVAGAALKVSLVKGSYQLPVREVQASSPTMISFKVEAPLDCPGGHYDLIVHTSPTDSLVRHAAFEVRYKRMMLDWNPRYVLSDVRKFRLGVKTLHMQLDESGTVNVFLTNGNSSVIWGTQVAILGPDSVEADFDVAGAPVGTVWGIEVNTHARTVLRTAKAIEKVKTIPVVLDGANGHKKGVRVIPAGNALRLDLGLPEGGRVEYSLVLADGRVQARRDLGVFPPGPVSLSLQYPETPAAGVVFWRVRVDGKIFGTGIAPGLLFH